MPVTRRKSASGIHVGQRCGGQHADIGAVVDGLLGKQRPLHEIDEVRADVAGALALLGGVEEPRRPDVRRARDNLHQVVDAFHVDGRLRSVPFTISPNVARSFTSARCSIVVISNRSVMMS